MTAFGKILEPTYRSKLERDYAQLLDLERAAGTIRAWWYEDVGLRLGHDCRLHVDFMVQLADLSIEFREVKGPFQRDDAMAKLRTAASKFPFIFRLVTRSKSGEWEIREVGAPRKSVPKPGAGPPLGVSGSSRRAVPASAQSTAPPPKRASKVGKWKPGDPIRAGHVLVNGEEVWMTVKDALAMGERKGATK